MSYNPEGLKRIEEVLRSLPQGGENASRRIFFSADNALNFADNLAKNYLLYENSFTELTRSYAKSPRNGKSTMKITTSYDCCRLRCIAQGLSTPEEHEAPLKALGRMGFCVLEDGDFWDQLTRSEEKLPT